MRYLIVVVLLGLGVAVYLFMKPASLRVGEEIPYIELETATGAWFDIEKYDGKTLCLIFFSPDDDASRTMFSEFHYITEQFRGNAQIKYIAIAVDGNGDRVKLFLSQYRFPGDVLMDSDKELSTQFRLSNFPAIFLVDADWRVRYTFSGWDREHIREIIPALRLLAK
ncbi:MAG: redoxin domain-containing protein [Ignavibacteriae bacterium]|nr:redoxin domain-containing protein [Ignavibacteriota bacterium]